MASISDVHQFVERLRKEAIGEPSWIINKHVYEFSEHSAKVVAVLKLTRAAQGLTSLDLLRRSGLFIDFGSIMRCINDCVDECYFLLESYPNTSSTVDHFVKAFFEGHIDGHLSRNTPPVPSQKIRSAMVRVMKGYHDDALQKLSERLFKTFSGYVHANYAHVMEVYNAKERNFCPTGVPSVQQREMRIEFVQIATNSVLYAAAFAAHTLNLEGLRRDIFKTVQP